MRELLAAARDFAGIALMLAGVVAGYATLNPPAPAEKLAHHPSQIEARTR